MNPNERRKAAREFVGRWQEAEGNEQRESNKFWIELCGEVLGIPNPTHELDFERKVKGRRIDVFYEDRSVLIENKSRGVSLDAPEQRGKDRYGNPRMVTPFEQAKWYADNITPRSVMPKWIITCNFDEIRIYDLDRDDAETNYETMLLGDLANDYHRLDFLVSKANSRIEREKELSVRAGEVVGRLYDAFSKAYLDIEHSELEQRSLNILITRIVFLLFAEDADLLHERDGFYRYLKNFQVQHMRQALIDLFDVLRTPKEGRDPYLSDELKVFPYINGGLFADDVVVPQFDSETREILLREASAEFDWSHISPTIFGAVFESTLNPETRRAGGMHYTSVENIHKVTGPLFYDALKAELTSIEGVATKKERDFKLRAFRRKLASIRILDPACGSGNFLTETYISLRRLENRVLEGLYGDQMAFGGELDPIQVTLDQFYGIEINDFAVEVAKTALWIAELQMLDQTREILGVWIDPLPLKSNENIHEGNALRMDWNDVLAAESCSYVIGNPPFLGSSVRSKQQTDDLSIVYAGEKRWGKCDYCVGWYRKAASYMRGTRCAAALVSTNSITQGEQVQPTWERLFNEGVVINFAYKTFVWDSEASDKAQVHCVIIGFSYNDAEPRALYDAGGVARAVNINGYLIDAPNLFIRNRGKAISERPGICQGNKPVDGGNLTLKPAEAASLISADGTIGPFVRPYLGSSELINARERYCLWLKDAPDEVLRIPVVRERLDGVAAARLKSPTREFRDYADRPHLFVQDRQPDTTFIAIPEVSSQRRLYIPIAVLGKDVIVSNKVYFIPDGTLYVFGILCSRMHNAWMRVIAGRLKSDYSYSPSVYNTLPLPFPSCEQRKQIEVCAQAVLDARAQHEERSLAQMYDGISPMPAHPTKADLKKYDQFEYANLLSAHEELDAAVEAAYGIDSGGDEEKIVAHLFRLYAEKTKE